MVTDGDFFFAQKLAYSDLLFLKSVRDGQFIRFE